MIAAPRAHVVVLVVLVVLLVLVLLQLSSLVVTGMKGKWGYFLFGFLASPA